MKPTKSKAQVRAELDSLVDQYINDGGGISKHSLGESGRDVNQPLEKSPAIEKNTQSRTPVTDVVKAIEERKKNKNKPELKTTRVKRQKKKLIVDDFGEPLRWIWVEE
jgi:hypothetical protein